MNSRARLRWALAIVGVWGAMLVSRTAGAESLVIQFETFGEKQPGALCVVGEFVQVGKGPASPVFPSDEQVAQLHELSYTMANDGLGGTLKSKGPAEERTEGPVVRVPNDSGCDLDKLRYFCTNNSFGGGRSSLAVLHVKDAIVSDVQLSQTVARLEVIAPVTARGTPVHVELLGGTYREQVPLSVRLSNATPRLDIPLVPRFVDRTLVRPKFLCASTDPNKVEAKGCTASGSPPGSSYRVWLTGAPHPEISLKECGHTFSHRIDRDVPQEPIALKPTKFWFRWERHCLASRRGCPTVSWPASDVRCDSGVSRESQVCEYHCTGPARFPAEGVRLSFPQPNGGPTWTEEISYPGITVHGYVPPEQRRVPLKWAWPADTEVDKTHDRQRERRRGQMRVERASLPGDELSYLEVKTPEGKVHRVRWHAAQLRVPELDCEDYLSYRYVGRRSFREEAALVDPESGITLADPDKLHRSPVNLGFVGGGGYQWTSGMEGHGGQPYAEAAVYVAVRSWATRLFSRLWEPEIRAGALLSRQMYRVGDTPDTPGQDPEQDPTWHWQMVPYWHIYGELGVRSYLVRSKWSLAFGVGAGYGTGYWLKEDSLAESQFLGTGHLSISYELIYGLAFEFQYRAFLGERYGQTKFDPVGVVSKEPNDRASLWSHNWGLMIRFDDLL